jgi:hypothetical protein
MTQYMILIYEDEAPYLAMTQEENQEIFAAHTRFAGQVGEHGATLLGGNALEPTTTATTVRNDIVTDGPFAETKEVLGGYYMIDARDLDHALEIAKLCPAKYGGVEVRPIMDLGGM